MVYQFNDYFVQIFCCQLLGRALSCSLSGMVGFLYLQQFCSFYLLPNWLKLQSCIMCLYNNYMIMLLKLFCFKQAINLEIRSVSFKEKKKKKNENSFFSEFFNDKELVNCFMAYLCVIGPYRTKKCSY